MGKLRWPNIRSSPRLIAGFEEILKTSGGFAIGNNHGIDDSAAFDYVIEKPTVMTVMREAHLYDPETREMN